MFFPVLQVALWTGHEYFERELTATLQEFIARSVST